jgi:indolepyruvate decarboxylase
VESGERGTQPLGRFLFSHLRSLGVHHCFGLPGDYILPLFRQLEETPGIEGVVATHEPCAAFSADAYARYTGLGVLLVTYGVGGLNALNGVACAHAESSPVLVVSGGPRSGSEGDRPFAAEGHHFVKHASSQLDAYRQVTDLALRVESRETAAQTIRRAAAHAARVKLPVYLEIPTDLMTAGIPVGGGAPEPQPSGAVDRVVPFFVDRIREARNPVLLAGVEVARYGLQAEVRRIMQAGKIPVATSILGKGVFDEWEPGMLGVYGGVLSPARATRKIVEGADLVVMLGMKVTDVNCGAFTADLDRDRVLVARSGWVGDGRFRFGRDVPFDRFVRELSLAVPYVTTARGWPDVKRPDVRASGRLMDRYLAAIEDRLTEKHVVIADAGDGCYGSLFLRTRRDGGYLAPTFYNSMGFAVPAAVGVQLADPACRPIVLVGDGAFQMTGLELSTLASRGLNPVVVVFNNDGYGTQRLFVDGPFNDIRRWNYGKIVDLIGGGRSWRATTEKELGDALDAALGYVEGPSLIEAVLPKGSISTGLELFGRALMREKNGICPLNRDDEPCGHQDRCAFCRASIWE